MHGGRDDDKVYGGLGRDTVDGGPGVDWVYGGGGTVADFGNDTLFGRGGMDRMYGGAGNDRLDTGPAGASSPFNYAFATAEELRARPLLEEMRLLAQRGRIEPAPAALPVESEAPAGLTARELEVLALVARGRRTATSGVRCS